RLRVPHGWPLIHSSFALHHLSQFEINHAVRRHNAVFIFHVRAWAKVHSSAGVFNQWPPGCDVPKTDSLLNVSVESSAGDISHVERSAAEYSTFAHTMNHLLEQREICVDRLTGLGEPDRDHCFSKVRAVAYVKRIAIELWSLAFLPLPHFPADWVVNNTDRDLIAKAQRNRNAKMWNPVEIIHRAIKRIDDPLVLAGLITHDSFFAIKRVFWKFFEKQLRN